MKKHMTTGLSVLILGVLITTVIWGLRTEPASAHCQMPCGIYDDPARIASLKEDAATITKAITNIIELAPKQDAQSLNQATRWIATKEDHASDIITVVAEYFLAQRVKPVEAGTEGYDAYLRSLADHHAVMVAAMKAKQQCDLATAGGLDQAIDTLAKHYQPASEKDPD
jgi:nickel superoxide dismutase